VLALTTLAVPVVAQTTPAEMSGAPLSAEERAKFEALIRDLQDQAASGVLDPQLQTQAAQLARRADDIANPEMAAEREKVLRFLGIDPESEHALFIFVSWSMPLDMLRAYAVEAMWTGATLVFRGIPPNRNLGDFFLKDLPQLVWDKGASAAISIDPRLFDSYQITTVPSIVLTRTRDNFTCIGAGERIVQANGQTGSYPLCPPIPDEKFLKISGAVTLDYALETFRSVGWREADVYLHALRKGYPPGQQASREQRPFRGEWKNALSPQQAMAEAGAGEATR